MEITRNTVVRLDRLSVHTPERFRESGVFGRVEDVTPYLGADGKTYDSYTLGTIEAIENGGYMIRPCGFAYYIPALTVVEVMGRWNPVKREIEATAEVKQSKRGLS